MNSADMQSAIALAKDAIASFLQTLLGQDVVVNVDTPVPSSTADVQVQSKAYVSVVGQLDRDGAFVALLEPKWVGVLSTAMLGEAMALDDEGAVDLLAELSAQGYGSIRNQLSSAGTTLPDARFKVVAPGADVPPDALPAQLVEISFSAQVDGGTLGGMVMMAAPEAPAASPGARAAAPARQPAAAPPPAPAAPVDVAPAAFPELGSETLGGDGEAFGLLAEVELEVTVELGRRKIPLADVLRLTTGSVIELEKLVGEPLEVYANGRLIAEGEAVVIDEQFGIRITRLASARQRTKAFV